MNFQVWVNCKSSSKWVANVVGITTTGPRVERNVYVKREPTGELVAYAFSSDDMGADAKQTMLAAALIEAKKFVQ